MSIYLDTSVIVPMFVIDTFTDRAKAFLNTRPALAISDFGAAEFASMMARRVRTREITAEQARAAFASFDDWKRRATPRAELRSTDIGFVETILRRLDLPLRTPDAIHIAIAQRLGAELATFDEKMAACARGVRDRDLIPGIRALPKDRRRPATQSSEECDGGEARWALPRCPHTILRQLKRRIGAQCRDMIKYTNRKITLEMDIY